MKVQTCLISVALALPLVMVMQKTSGKNLINSTCQALSREDPNIEYGFCTSSLQAAPGSHPTTLQGLGSISIRLVQFNITDTRCFIKNLVRNRTGDSYLRQCLSDCLQLFTDAIPSAKLAMRYYTKKRFDEANVEISSIMDAAATCEDGFKERGDVVSPLTERNHYTFQLSAIALSLIHIIQTSLSPPAL